MSERRQKSGTGREHAGEKALHVGGAAAVELAVALGDDERIGCPWLAVDGHDVGMARERDAAHMRGADGGVKSGLAAVCGGHDVADHAVL